jgi:hypothetical protein
MQLRQIAYVLLTVAFISSVIVAVVETGALSPLVDYFLVGADLLATVSFVLPIARRSPLGPDIIVAYNEAPSLSHFGLGVTFMWAGDAADEMKAVTAGDPQLSSPIGIYSFFDPNVDVRGGQIYRAVGAIDFKITNPRAGKIITNAVNAANPNYNGMLNLLYS